MAELIPDVLFLTTNTEGYSDVEIAALNFELMDVLRDLKPESDAYMSRAMAFHKEVAQRQA